MSALPPPTHFGLIWRHAAEVDRRDARPGAFVQTCRAFGVAIIWVAIVFAIGAGVFQFGRWLIDAVGLAAAIVCLSIATQLLTLAILLPAILRRRAG